MEYPEQRDRLRFDNCGITLLEWGEKLRAVTVNETGHLTEYNAVKAEF